MKMKVAVIGANGSMGSNITKSLAKAGHELYVYSPETCKLFDFVATVQKEIPMARIVITVDAADAAASAEVIIPAVWYSKQAEVANSIRKAAAGKIVVSLANPLNETYDGLVTAAGVSAAEELAILLPDSKVVKAFNTVFAADFANPEFGGLRADNFIAADDEQAVEIVSTLVKDAGFNPIYVGKLQASRTLENMTVLLIGLSNRYNYNWLAGWKVLHEAQA